MCLFIYYTFVVNFLGVSLLQLKKKIEVFTNRDYKSCQKYNFHSLTYLIPIIFVLKTEQLRMCLYYQCTLVLDKLISEIFLIIYLVISQFEIVSKAEGLDNLYISTVLAYDISGNHWSISYGKIAVFFATSINWYGSTYMFRRLRRFPDTS